MQYIILGLSLFNLLFSVYLWRNKGAKEDIMENEKHFSTQIKNTGENIIMLNEKINLLEQHFGIKIKETKKYENI